MRLEIRCEDRIGMARGVLDLLIPYGIDMRRIEIDSTAGRLYVGFDDIEFRQLQRLLSDLRRLSGVDDVKTVNFTPSEREQNALLTLMEALPDGVVAVDLAGNVTLATRRAVQDIGVAREALIGHPLGDFIRSVPFERLDWQDLGSGVTKRVRLNGQLVLLEMQPFFVSNETEALVCAGGVIHIRSAQRLERQTSSLRKAPAALSSLGNPLGDKVVKSPTMLKLFKVAQAYLENDTPMLVTGELATGKKHIVQTLFNEWKTRHLELDARLGQVSGSLLTVDQLTEVLKTNAWVVVEDFERMSKPCQIFLARWLAEQPEKLYQEESPTRVIALSRMKASELAHMPDLLPELFYSVNSFQMDVPPLRQRREDLSNIVKGLLESLVERVGLPSVSVSKEAMALMKVHHWSGNFKELEACLAQAANIATEGVIDVDDLPIEVSESMPIELMSNSLDKTLKAYEAELLRKLYPRYPSTRKLAQFLNVSHSSIASKLKEYGIT